ncbi:MAG TPA: two-component system sensor histidine kinase CreC [Rhodocyclaceae bacterium]
MKLWARVFLGYFLVVGIAGWFVLRVFVAEVKPGVREAVEEVMVDSVHLVAELAAADLKAGRIQDGAFARSIEAYSRRTVSAPIWGREKQSLDFRIYVTDAKGIVRFDSDGEAVGQDYSRWRDVALTLAGRYGARATRDDPDDETSSVLFVAAPIVDQGRIIGVATVAKPVSALAPIIARGERSVFRHGALLLAATLLVGSLFTIWLTLSMNRLLRYARALARGEKPALPHRGRDEIGELARALESMRAELDGRAYVERYVEHLTHEMKSPLAAIRGAAELLAEPLPEADRLRFSGNITAQGARLQDMIDKLLRLAQLEHKAGLEAPRPVTVDSLFAELQPQFESAAAQRGVRLEWQGAAGLTVRGDAFLLTQALANLVDNAIAFSPAGGEVTCHAESDDGRVRIEVCDQGPGIPDFAQERLFERFFSLPRPDGQPKSSGLGLALVQEVAQLHGGSIAVENRPGGGACATLSLPSG